MGEYMRGETNAHKQQYRDEVITTNIDDFHSFNYKLKKMVKESNTNSNNNSNIVNAIILGSENAFSKANEKLKNENVQEMKLEQAIHVKSPQE